jgi:toxin FitB
MLRMWIETQVMPAFQGRIIAVDASVAQRCAALHVPDPRPQRDSLIAATALVHRMTVITRNVRDFEPMGVQLLNPWRYE